MAEIARRVNRRQCERTSPPPPPPPPPLLRMGGGGKEDVSKLKIVLRSRAKRFCFPRDSRYCSPETGRVKALAFPASDTRIGQTRR